MKPSDRVLVNCGNGLCVWHTFAEWQRLVKGVDLEAARKAGRVPLETDTKENS